MTGRERVLKAIRHEETDRIPHYIELGTEELKKMQEFTGNKNYKDTLQNDMDTLYFDGFLRRAPGRPGYYLDDFGVCWNRNCVDKDIGMIEEYQIKEPEDLEQYEFPKVREAMIRREMEKFLRDKGEAFKTAGMSFTMFERAWTLCGMENLLIFMIEEPEFVHRLMEKICDYNAQVLQIVLEYDIDGFCFGDDWGQQKGMIMGPEKWRQFIKPQMQRLYQMVKEKGKVVMQHSCGDIGAILEELSEMGLDVYQTVQPEIYDLQTLKEGVGKRLTFWGGISTQNLLPFASPDQVEEKIVETMKIMKPKGGYILAPTHAVPCDVPPQNIERMVFAFNHQERFL